MTICGKNFVSSEFLQVLIDGAVSHAISAFLLTLFKHNRHSMCKSYRCSIFRVESNSGSSGLSECCDLPTCKWKRLRFIRGCLLAQFILNACFFCFGNLFRVVDPLCFSLLSDVIAQYAEPQPLAITGSAPWFVFALRMHDHN